MITHMPKTLMASSLGFAAVLGNIGGAATAQNYPTRPVTLVVTFAPGGGDDVLARIIAPSLSELLGQPLVIENVGGAGGMTGVSRVAKSAPDGYQFVLGGTGTFAANQTLYKHPFYDPVRDFVPVALVAEQPIVLIARRNLPASNLPEFISYSKANQNHMQYGSPGTGSTSHLACVLLNSAVGIAVTHVPYRGGAPAYQDLIAGRIDYLCPYSSTAIPQIESKTVKPLTILSKNRLATVPNLATAQEQGLPNFEAYQWFAFFLPKGTPAPIVQKLHDAIVAAVETRPVQDRLKDLGTTIVTPERRSPEYLKKFVASEIGKWAGAIKAARITAD